MWWGQSGGAEKNTISYRAIELQREEEPEDIINYFGEIDGDIIINFLEKYDDMSDIWSEDLAEEDKMISEQSLYKLFKTRVRYEIYITQIASELK